MREMTAGGDGWCILGVGDCWTSLPGPYPNTGAFLRVATVNYVDERRPGAPRPFMVERHCEFTFDDPAADVNAHWRGRG